MIGGSDDVFTYSQKRPTKVAKFIDVKWDIAFLLVQKASEKKDEKPSKRKNRKH